MLLLALAISVTLIAAAPRPRDHALAGGGILRCLGLRSFGPTAVSPSISRFGLRTG